MITISSIGSSVQTVLLLLKGSTKRFLINMVHNVEESSGRMQTYQLPSSKGASLRTRGPCSSMVRASIKEFIGLIPTWNFENIFCISLTYCQATIIT